MTTGTPAGANRRIVIIGAVAAGTSAAAKARRNDENAEIVLYEKDRHISYSGCGLPYYIGGTVAELSTLVPRDPAFFRSKYGVEVRIRQEVLSVDPVTRTLRIRDLDGSAEYEDRYDTLVLATGAAPVRPPIPGADQDHVFVLRTPSHAAAIRTFLEQRKPKHAVVVGSGFIGLEMVEALAGTGLSVTLVEMLPDLCPFVDPDMAPYIEKELDRHQVRSEPGTKVSEIHADSVTLDSGETVPADLVLLATGIRPETRLAKEMGVAIGPTGAIRVDAQMRTSIPDVYACGDCAENMSLVHGSPIYRPLGSTANKTGRIAGDVMTGGSLSHRGILGTGIFRVFDRTVAATGLNEKEAREQFPDAVVSHNIKPDRPAYFGADEMVIKSIAAPDGCLLGFQIVGGRGVDKRIDVLVTALTAGLKAEDLFHLDLAYAPPFSTTKDPVHYTGMILDNAVHRQRRLMTADQLSSLEPGTYTVLDTRVGEQYEAGHVPGAKSLPHDRVRDAIQQQEGDLSDPDRVIITYCNRGTTGNAVQNILINRGYRKVYTLSGGFRQFDACRRNRRNAAGGKDAT